MTAVHPHANEPWRELIQRDAEADAEPFGAPVTWEAGAPNTLDVAGQLATAGATDQPPSAPAPPSTVDLIRALVAHLRGHADLLEDRHRLAALRLAHDLEDTWLLRPATKEQTC